MEVSLFFQATSNRMKEYSLKLHQEKFRLDIKEEFLPRSVIGHCNGLHKEEVELPLELPSLEAIKSRLGT